VLESYARDLMRSLGGASSLDTLPAINSQYLARNNSFKGTQLRGPSTTRVMPETDPELGAGGLEANGVVTVPVGSSPVPLDIPFMLPYTPNRNRTYVLFIAG
jgi:hypothetical protein